MDSAIPGRYPTVVAACLSAAFTLGAAIRLWRNPSDAHTALLGLVLPAVLLAGVFAHRVGRSVSRPLETLEPARGSRRRALLLSIGLIVVVAGAFLRVQGSSRFPPPEGIGYEELQIGCMGWDILVHREQPDEHRLPAWLNALCFTLREPSIESMRLPFVILSALSPLFLFLAARRVAAPEVAILATGFWAVAWWPILAGRIADEIYSVAPLQVLALALLFRAQDGRRPLAAWGAGLLCGIFLTEYTAYHAFPLLVLAAGMGALLRAAWRARAGSPGLSPRGAFRAALAPHRHAIAAFLLSFTALALPVSVAAVRAKSLYFFEGVVRHGSAPDAIYRKPLPEYVGILKGRVVNLWRATHVDGAGEGSPWLDPDRAAMLDRATFGFLVAGVALLLLTPFRRRHGLLLAVTFVPCAVFLAIPGNEDFIRYFVVLPLVFLGAAAGVQVAWAALPLAGRTALLVAGTAAILHASLANARVVRKVSESDAVRRNYLDPDAVLGRYIGTLEPGSRTVVLYDQQLPPYPHVELLTWLLHGRSARVATTLRDALLEPPPGTVPPPRDGPLRFIVWPSPSQPGLGELLNRHVGPSRLEATLPILYHAEPLEVWRVDPPSEAPVGHPAGGVLVRLWAGSPDVDPRAPDLSGAQLLSVESQPAFSSFAIPTGLKMDYVFQPRADGKRLWVSMDGVPDDREAGRLRLGVRGGVAWLFQGSSRVLQLEAPGAWESADGSLLPASPPRPLRLVYRYDGPDWPAVQLTWVDANGLPSLVASTSDERFVHLSELPREDDGWLLGPPIVNLSGREAPLRIGGVLYAHGMGFHAPGRSSWQVPPGAARLVAEVGIQDLPECDGQWRANVRVRLDSAVEPAAGLAVRSGQLPQALDVPLAGARRVTLELDDGGDGVSCDHVNLIEARFVMGR